MPKLKNFEEFLDKVNFMIGYKSPIESKKADKRVCENHSTDLPPSHLFMEADDDTQNQKQKQFKKPNNNNFKPKQRDQNQHREQKPKYQKQNFKQGNDNNKVLGGLKAALDSMGKNFGDKINDMMGVMGKQQKTLEVSVDYISKKLNDLQRDVDMVKEPTDEKKNETLRQVSQPYNMKISDYFKSKEPKEEDQLENFLSAKEIYDDYDYNQIKRDFYSDAIKNRRNMF